MDRLMRPLQDQTSESAQAAAPDAPSELFQDLADVVAAVGSAQFYSALSGFVARMTATDRYLVMRYARFSKPEFLVNESLSTEATHQYLTSIYRLDPLMRMVRGTVDERVLTFEGLKQTDTDTLFYEENYRTAQILDELVMLIPAAGGVWVAVCVDRETETFTEAERAAVAALYPTIEQLHRLHVERCIYGRKSYFVSDTHTAVLVMDSEGYVEFRSRPWSQRVTARQEKEFLDVAALASEGFHAIDATNVLHWETLDQMNGVAPGGKAFFLEERAPGYVDIATDDYLMRFANAHRLTPREREIVELILRGQPPSLIARNFGVSVGTIRNHKHRLYFKLDITTERELFAMFMDMFLTAR